MMGQIDNADETPMWFDIPSSTIIMQCGAKDMKLLSTGNEYSRFTVMLECIADGRKLPPFNIFKRKTMPKEVFPPHVVVRVKKKGYIVEATDARTDTSSLEPSARCIAASLQHAGVRCVLWSLNRRCQARTGRRKNGPRRDTRWYDVHPCNQSTLC
ncbi:hypothetical protein HPB51_020338 [Rhipicephalus microplus]|uniref:Uncharacterized protein n=1 Tax=Rhipicephalus microplus TaxID=6941 RepID=A0A9J6DWS9_RHIMP|nr:hypothetical protein HPB51_020338 [Rhipicephalus microplus]